MCPDEGLQFKPAPNIVILWVQTTGLTPLLIRDNMECSTDTMIYCSHNCLSHAAVATVIHVKSLKNGLDEENIKDRS
jgi:hypothetical protein